MVAILAQMGLLIVCGVGWRIIRPGGLDADLARRVLTTLVFNLLMPALILSVLWKQRIGLDALRVTAFGLTVIGLGLGAAWLLARALPAGDRRLGAAMLAVGFPNVTYFGLPLLEHLFGRAGRLIVIEIDLFAALPAVLLVGPMIGRRYGDGQDGTRRLRLLNNPPVWAAVLAITLNRAAVPVPPWLDHGLDRLAAAAVPAMLIALGMGLSLGAWRPRDLAWTTLTVALRLLAIPWLAVGVGRWLGFSGDTLTALVLEAAMPCMLLGVVYCDRYRLDTGFYAMAVALTTLGAAVSLPFWQIAANR